MARRGLATSLEPPPLSSLSGLPASCTFQVLSLFFPFKQCIMENSKNSTKGRLPPACPAPVFLTSSFSLLIVLLQYQILQVLPTLPRVGHPL